MSNMPGFGDEATWPAYDGHPNDPRNPGDDDDLGPLPPEINEESPWMAFMRPDKNKARVMLQSILRECEEWDTPESIEVAKDARYWIDELDARS